MRTRLLTAGVYILLMMWLPTGAEAQPSSRRPESKTGFHESVASTSRMERGDGAMSVIVEFKNQQSEFADLAKSLVTPQLDAIRDALRKRTARSRELLAALKADPGNVKLASEYEDNLSSAFAEISTSLEDFAEGESRVSASLDKAIQSVGQARTALKIQDARNIEQLETFERESAALETQLKKLADQTRTLLTPGRAIPEVLNVEIQKLQSTLVVSRQNQAITERMIAASEQSFRKLSAYEAELERKKGELSIAYHQAQGQQVLLSNIARLRETKLHGQRLGQEMQQAIAGLGTFITSMEDFGETFPALFQELATEPDAPEKMPVFGPKSGQQAGVEILKRYLTPPVSVAKDPR